jgi:hypothetical protein
MVGTATNAPVGRESIRRLVFLWWLVVTVAAGMACLVFYSHRGWLVIRWDGFGYYAYLPSVFIDGDLDMKTPIAAGDAFLAGHPAGFAWTGLQPWCIDPNATAPLSIRHCEGPIVDKYPVGTAVMELPFFAVAHIATLVADPDRAKGYSTGYQVANIFASVFFLGLGAALALVVLLRRQRESAAVVATALAVFATSVFNYATVDGSFSQVYSFAAIASLLFLTLSYRATSDGKAECQKALLIGAVIGLVSIVRIPNALVGALPLAIFIERLLACRTRRTVLAEGVCVGGGFVAVFLIQAAYWHARTGHWLLNSYSLDDPGFNWLSPHLLDFAFGVRKGLFVWAPCLLLVIPGLVLLVRRDRTLGLAISAILLAHLYVCASWWNWWFGAGYGSRPSVDVMPLAAVPLAASIEWIGGRIGNKVVFAGAAALVLLNLFLTVSYWRSFVPVDETTIADLLALPARWSAGE